MSNILVIEDNPQSARLAEKLLKRNGHIVTVADTGQEGFMQASHAPPDLILVDLGLPDVDGQTIIGVMKRQPNLVEVPMIAFTAWPAETAIEMAKAYGCDGVIIKPIDTKEFAKQVESFLIKKKDTPTSETESSLPESPEKPSESANAKSPSNE